MYERLKRFIESHRVLVAIAKPYVVFRQWYRTSMGYLLRSRSTRSYLKAHQIRKLQIGAGPNILEGWFNTDAYPASRRVVFLNAKKPFPFRDGTFDYVTGVFILHHLDLRRAVPEIHRVLRPGGKAVFVENSAYNGFLMLGRALLTGRFGIHKSSSKDEYPLGARQEAMSSLSTTPRSSPSRAPKEYRKAAVARRLPTRKCCNAGLSWPTRRSTSLTRAWVPVRSASITAV